MKVIYFELNNWSRGRDYPDAEPFVSWMVNDLKQKLTTSEVCLIEYLCFLFTIQQLRNKIKVYTDYEMRKRI